MKKFDMRHFVMTTLETMRRDGYSEAQVRRFALTWYNNGTLRDDDLMQIEEWYAPAPEDEDAGEEVMGDE